MTEVILAVNYQPQVMLAALESMEKKVRPNWRIPLEGRRTEMYLSPSVPHQDLVLARNGALGHGWASGAGTGAIG